MKSLVLALCLLGAVRAFGQAPAAQARTFKPKQALTPTYKTLADTTSNPQFLSLTEPVTVVRMATPRWAIINRGKAEVLVATSNLVNFNPAGIPLQPKESANKGATISITGPPVYAVAKTTNALLKRTARHLALDLGITPPLTQPFVADENGVPLTFDTEAVLLNYLDQQGWNIISHNQEIQPATSGATKYENVYILKRKQ